MSRFNNILESFHSIMEGNDPVIQYDPNEFDSFIVAPNKLDDQALFAIADLFDGKVSAENFNHTDVIDQKSPNTSDKITESLAIAYITKDGIPVAACTLRDPTQVNYDGIVSNDYYELKSGVSLENRLEQEFFEVHPDYHDQGLAMELRRLVSSVVDKTFTVIGAGDQSKSIGLEKAGFEPVAAFNVDWTNEPVLLWIN